MKQIYNGSSDFKPRPFNDNGAFICLFVSVEVL